MGDRRPKKPLHRPARPSPDVFTEFGLNRADFVIESGGGKSFLAKQRIVWMTIRHRPTGREVHGKIGTTKKGAGAQEDVLLRMLLKSFRRN